MKIAQVCPYDFSRPGGVKSHITSLSKYLMRLGHEVKIIAPDIHADLVHESGVHFFGKNLSMNFGGTKIDINLAGARELKKLKQFFREEQFDIIHYHTIWNPLLPIQIRLNAKAKHIATFHDTPRSQLLGKTIMPAAAASIFPFLDAVLSVSEIQKQYIARFSKKKIHVIPNGIDLEFWNEPTSSLPEYQDGKFNLLFLGRLEPRKGLIYALRCFQALKEKHDNLRLLIAGDGDDRTIAEKFISENGLHEAIQLLGFVNEEKKRQLLKTADLYLAPAIYGESFGIVLLEAMGMGTPVSGFGNAGYKAVISEKLLPFFPDPKDQQGLNQSVEALLKDPQLREELAKDGLLTARKYNWMKLVGEIELIYKNVLSVT